MFSGAYRSPFQNAFASSGAAANPLASVPWVAQWKFNNDGNDSIGSNNLTNNNSATFTTGKLGGATGATQLTSSSVQYWTIADNAALSFGTGVKWLIAMWLYPTDFSFRCIMGKGVTAEYFIDTNGSGAVRLYAGGAQKINYSGALTAGAWNLLCVWYDGTTYNMSINNGTAITGGSGDTTDSTNTLYIGARPDALSSAFCWNGRIDNVCIAKSASTFVTQAVLDALYNNGNGTETLT